MRTKAFKHSNIHLPKLRRNVVKEQSNRSYQRIAHEAGPDQPLKKTRQQIETKLPNPRRLQREVGSVPKKSKFKIIYPANPAKGTVEGSAEYEIKPRRLRRYLRSGETHRAAKMREEDESRRKVEVGEKSFDNPENEIRIDFDGTIVKQHDDHTQPHEFELRDGAKEGIERIHEQGRKIIIWTSHPNHDEIVRFLNKNHIPFDGIERKPEFLVHIDDKVIEAGQSWENIMKEVPDPPRQPSEHSYSYHTLKFKANEAVREFLDFLDHIKCPVVGLDNYAAMAHAVEEPEHIIVFGGLKSEAKAHEKVNRDYDGDWSRLLDILRATVVMDTPECLYEALDEAEEKWELVRKQDKTHDPIAEPHILTNWKLSCGIIAEVQWFLKPHFLKWRQLAGEVPQEHLAEIHDILATKQLDMDEDRGPEDLMDKTNEGLDEKAYKHPSGFQKLERNVLKRNENRYRAREDAASSKQRLGPMSRDAVNAPLVEAGTVWHDSEGAAYDDSVKDKARRYVRRNIGQQGRAHHRLMPSPRHAQREGGHRARELRSGETHETAKIRRESGVRKPHEANPVYGVKGYNVGSRVRWHGGDSSEEEYKRREGPAGIGTITHLRQVGNTWRAKVKWDDGSEEEHTPGLSVHEHKEKAYHVNQIKPKEGIHADYDNDIRMQVIGGTHERDDRKHPTRGGLNRAAQYLEDAEARYLHTRDSDTQRDYGKGIELESDGEKRVRRTYGSTRSAYASMFAGRRQQDLQRRPGKLNIFGTKRRLAGKMAVRGPTVPKEMFPKKAKEERYNRKSLDEQANERARNVDLIELPEDVEGTKCGNCIFFKEGYCHNSAVQQEVKENYCCNLWEHEGMTREWEAKSLDGDEKAYKHPNPHQKLERNVIRESHGRGRQQVATELAKQTGITPSEAGRKIYAKRPNLASSRQVQRNPAYKQGTQKRVKFGEIPRGGETHHSAKNRHNIMRRQHQERESIENRETDRLMGDLQGGFKPYRDWTPDDDKAFKHSNIHLPKLERNASKARMNRMYRQSDTIGARKTGRTVRSQASAAKIASPRQLLRDPATSGAIQDVLNEGGKRGESHRAARMRRDEEYKALSAYNLNTGGALVQTSLGPKIPRREHVHQPLPEKRKMRHNTDEMEHVIHENEGGYGPSVRPVDLRESLFVRKKAYKHSNINLPKLQRNWRRTQIQKGRMGGIKLNSKLSGRSLKEQSQDSDRTFGNIRKKIRGEEPTKHPRGYSEFRAGGSHRAERMREEHQTGKVTPMIHPELRTEDHVRSRKQGKSFDIPMFGSKSSHTAAVELGHYGGKVGGPARARKLSAARRAEIARMGGKARQRMLG